MLDVIWLMVDIFGDKENLLFTFTIALLAILIFLTSNCYTIIKIYLHAMYTAYLNCEIFWNFEAQEANKQKDHLYIKNAERLLKHANCWQHYYKRNCIITRRCCSSTFMVGLFLIIIVFAFLVVEEYISIIFTAFWVAFFILSILLVIYLYRGFSLSRRSPFPTNATKNILCDYFEILDPSLADKQLEKLERNISEIPQWFVDHKNECDFLTPNDKT
jgi:hypothetical protein